MPSEVAFEVVGSDQSAAFGAFVGAGLVVAFEFAVVAVGIGVAGFAPSVASEVDDRNTSALTHPPSNRSGLDRLNPSHEPIAVQTYGRLFPKTDNNSKKKANRMHRDRTQLSRMPIYVGESG